MLNTLYRMQRAYQIHSIVIKINKMLHERVSHTRAHTYIPHTHKVRATVHHQQTGRAAQQCGQGADRSIHRLLQHLRHSERRAHNDHLCVYRRPPPRVVCAGHGQCHGKQHVTPRQPLGCSRNRQDPITLECRCQHSTVDRAKTKETSDASDDASWHCCSFALAFAHTLTLAFTLTLALKCGEALAPYEYVIIIRLTGI